jgi:hypothetical protein
MNQFLLRNHHFFCQVIFESRIKNKTSHLVVKFKYIKYLTGNFIPIICKINKLLFIGCCTFFTYFRGKRKKLPDTLTHGAKKQKNTIAHSLFIQLYKNIIYKKDFNLYLYYFKFQ